MIHNLFNAVTSGHGYEGHTGISHPVPVSARRLGITMKSDSFVKIRGVYIVLLYTPYRCIETVKKRNKSQEILQNER